MSGVGGNLVEIQPASASSDSNDPLAGIINGIPGLGSVLDNITAGIGNGISDIQGSILGNLTSALGVKNMYLLYVSKMCEGNFRNPDDINSLVVDACYSYRDKGAGEFALPCYLSSCLSVLPKAGEFHLPLVHDRVVLTNLFLPNQVFSKSAIPSRPVSRLGQWRSLCP